MAPVPELEPSTDGPQDYDTPSERNWFGILELAKRLNAQGDPSSPGVIKGSLDLSQAEWMQAIKYAKRERPVEHKKLYELMGRKIPEPRAKKEVEEDPELGTDQPGDIDSEEVSEADVVAHIINLLTGFDKATQTRLIATACVFHGLDFASLTGEHLVTSRPREAAKDYLPKAAPEAAG